MSTSAAFSDDERGEFWYRLVLELRGGNSRGYTVYSTKEEFMEAINTWMADHDRGLASIAWDLVDMERGEDNL